MLVRILDLDDGVARQGRLRQRASRCLPLRKWGPRLRLACAWSAFQRFEIHLARLLGGTRDRPGRMTFVGSGDFHHVSLALLRRQVCRCNLLVLDKHPDWMRRVPFLHCGTWLYHAAALPQVERIFHVGGEVDFDNHYRWLAPWDLLHSGKIQVLPASRVFRGRSWRKVPHAALRAVPDEPAGAEEIDALLDPWSDELARLPLYISLDRDVLRADQAAVNWDSGRLVSSEVLGVLRGFLARSAGLAGMDVVGDWSSVRIRGWLRRFLHWTEHPPLDVDPQEALRINEQLNLELVDTIEAARGQCAAQASQTITDTFRRRGRGLP
jgi:hypothetical protein